MNSNTDTDQFLKTRKIGIIGVGHIGQALVRAFVQSNTVDPQQFFATNRTYRKLQKVIEDHKIQGLKNNEELVDQCDVVLLAVKPQDILATLEPIVSSFTPQHVVVSLAAGVPISKIKKMIPQVSQIIRVMPNTASRLGQGVVGYCLNDQARHLEPFIKQLLSPLGYVVALNEGDEFEALTVSSASGIGFIIEIMVYWQEWLEEHGFAPEVARQVTVKTFLGASALADEASLTALEELQNKVVSKKGVTAAGLDSMRELEIERLLRYSFEKAVLRDRELGQ